MEKVNHRRGIVEMSDGRVFIAWDVTGEKPREIKRGKYGVKILDPHNLWVGPADYKVMVKTVIAIHRDFHNQYNRKIQLKKLQLSFL